MALQKKGCKNHPETKSSRRCYHCREAVCKICQQIIEHHFFCGWKCYFKWKTITLYKKFKSFKNWNLVLFTLIIFFNIFIFFHFDNKIERLQVRKKTETSSDSAFFAVDSIRYPVQNILQLKINAPHGKLISLWRDSALVTSFAGNGGNIEFGDQVLTSGRNSFTLYAMDHTGRSSLIDSFTIYFSSQRIEYKRKPVYRVRTNEKSLALTFDGGWTNYGTKEILQILRENMVQCTIFLTGEFMGRYPEQVNLIQQDGHEIANHSLEHPHLTMLEIDGSSKSRRNVNRNFLYRQIAGADSMYFSITRKKMAALWRAPYGELNDDILLWAAEAGYKHIGWSNNCDTWDWVTDSTSSLYRTNLQILEHILGIEENGGLRGKIILMHLGTERRSDYPYLVLGKMIKELIGRGYKFEKVSKLLSLQSRKLH